MVKFLVSSGCAPAAPLLLLGALHQSLSEQELRRIEAQTLEELAPGHVQPLLRLLRRLVEKEKERDGEDSSLALGEKKLMPCSLFL